MLLVCGQPQVSTRVWATLEHRAQPPKLSCQDPHPYSPLPGPSSQGLIFHQPLLCIHNGLKTGPTSQRVWGWDGFLLLSLSVVPAHTWRNGDCEYYYYLGFKWPLSILSFPTSRRTQRWKSCRTGWRPQTWRWVTSATRSRLWSRSSGWPRRYFRVRVQVLLYCWD